MAKTEQMLRLKYIEELLRRRKEKGASFQEIENYLKEKFEEKDILDQLKFTERTFLRDKKAILEISGIEISYSRANNAYYISNEELELYEENIFDNLLLVEAYREVKGRENIMLFEKRKARGLQHLHGLIHAIVNKKVICFTYQKFWTDEKFERIVEPYALKEFEHRWYLLAKDHQSKGDKTLFMKTFGLDRISDLNVKNKTFKRETYEPQKAFENSFGIIATNGEEPQEIVLSFDWHQGNYIKALPLHPSQKIVSETNDELVISVFVVPTYDFEREILSYGDRVRIVEPKSFKAKIKSEVKGMLKNLS
ncbi:WYL domain-containing protein [Riemerella anatipestifer]|uniref:helix-turn-helix transcriptional regulator n=1 Tax=Riemerella anatipestifer TaxID=34085 RepID=UPI001374C88E|nr:WYL domain-containing protein [Riemerella anatipestifer]